MPFHRSKSLTFLILFAGIGGSPAGAQSSTNCIGLDGGMVHCNTMDMSQPNGRRR
jgi:hypothetical protein